MEQTLVAGGEGGLVTEARSALHRGMRDEAIAQAEAITGRRVAAFMTDQQYDPDISVIVFVFAPEDDCKQGRTARRG